MTTHSRRRTKPRQCARCGTLNPPKLSECSSCGTGLIKRRFSMTKKRIAAIHILAAKKGLIVGDDDELYRLRLQRIGVTSSKMMKQQHYRQFISEVRQLPDCHGG